ncbi:hypothetical protein KKC83_01435 [Patescibacteria group bacterium]|nr:hypothetical protein [Candidatus Falkowbacteria bacterium]MBU3906044.1 hypothetical protein [Patescibacteria group bacterium]MCG2698047.1 hypothetical protein [Candidatus Parcubacteria bacterium]MBU4015073.1 hypothetical protein [Patescibacteria group bacterium]MBU4026189.1 hypothetical protein [Patescibacteria group bacterium]
MIKNRLLNQAKKFRRNGYSLNEISQKLGISKSTASVWLRNEKMSEVGKRRFSDLIEQGQKKSKEAIKKKKKLIFKEIFGNCTVLVNQKEYRGDDFKLFLSLLYWCEGAKTGRRVIFINSDPKMIKVYMLLFRKAFNLNEDKFKAVLHLHSYHNTKELVNYWSKLTKINKNYFTIYKKRNTGKRKKEDYKGCVSIRYGDSKIFDEIFLIINRFIDLFKAGVG